MTGNPVFTSTFGQQITQYLAFKQSSGIWSETRCWYLGNFDRYCAEHQLERFDRATVEGWVLSLMPRQPGSRSWICYIRDFGRWLRANGQEDAYVLSTRWRSRNQQIQPYLLSSQEISQFFQTARRCKVFTPWPWQAAAFFALMHSCGLRTCEARRLTPADILWDKKLLLVRWSKGHRSRQLPVSEEILQLLREADHELKQHFGAQRPTFFTSSCGGALTGGMVASVFHQIWDQAGLPAALPGQRIRPYDFRHHFAYANLERWMAEGIDVNAMMPYLSRYMGHSSVESTYYYVHTSPDFMAGYASLAGSTGDILPEVGFE